MTFAEGAKNFKELFDYLLENMHETGYDRKHHSVSLKEIYLVLATTVPDLHDPEECPEYISVSEAILDCLETLSVGEIIDMLNIEFQDMMLPFRVASINAKKRTLNRTDTNRYFIFVDIGNTIYLGDSKKEQVASLTYARANLRMYLDGWAAWVDDYWHECTNANMMFYSFSLLYNLAYPPLFTDPAAIGCFPRVEHAKVDLYKYHLYKAINLREVYDKDEINYLCQQRGLPYRIRERRTHSYEKYYICREYLPIPKGEDE